MSDDSEPSNVSESASADSSPAQVSVQGEPTDNQVLAALNAWNVINPGESLSDYADSNVAHMRAALRAATDRSIRQQAADHAGREPRIEAVTRDLIADVEWRLGMNDDETVDEVVMQGAYVHFEDLGDAYMLIMDNGHQHIHVTIPAHTRRKAFVFEQYDPKEGTE